MNRYVLGLVLGWFVVGLLCSGLTLASAQSSSPIPLTRPGDRDFVLDRANLLAPTDLAEIRQTADRLLTEQTTPIIVVTIDSMADFGWSGMTIESFARTLFDQWQIGIAKRSDGSEWNRGILLLISKNDRKARIELGKGWASGQDATCDRIMQQEIVPKFKQGDYSAGILAGVKSLDAMARGQFVAKSVGYRWPEPWWLLPLLLGGAGLLLFTAISLMRRGSSGWAWIFWAALFGLLAAVVVGVFNSSRDGGSDDWSGGSFGGGSSGGGGSTGSW